MINPPKWKTTLQAVGIIFIICLLLVLVFTGVLSIMGSLLSLLRDSQMSLTWNLVWKNIENSFTSEISHVRQLDSNKLAAWGTGLTALFTMLLVRVTHEMKCASQRQVAGDAPLIKIDLELGSRFSEIEKKPNNALEKSTPSKRMSLASKPKTSAIQRELSIKPVEASPESMPEKHEPYPHDLVEEDEQVFNEKGVPSLTPPRYVFARISNVQFKPFAVARDINITVSLFRKNRSPGFLLEEIMNRRHVVRILEPNSTTARPLFNVAALEGFEVSVASVEYRDLRGLRKRTGGYGILTLTLKEDGSIHHQEGYSRPQGWEMP